MLTVQEMEKNRKPFKKFGFIFKGDANPKKESLMFEKSEAEKFIQSLKAARNAF